MMFISLRADSWRFLKTGKQDLISFYSRVTAVLWSSKVMNFYLSVKSSSDGALIGDTRHGNNQTQRGKPEYLGNLSK